MKGSDSIDFRLIPVELVLNTAQLTLFVGSKGQRSTSQDYQVLNYTVSIKTNAVQNNMKEVTRRHIKIC